MPPLVLFAAATTGSALLVRFIKQEWRRINDELDRQEAAEAAPAATLPVLRRDPATGEWRPV